MPANTLEFDSSDCIMTTVSAGRGWAISLPTHFLHGLHFSPGIDVIPLPETVSRTIHLVARQQELGTIPRDLAQVSRKVLGDELLPKLIELMPWIKPDIHIGES